LFAKDDDALLLWKKRFAADVAPLRSKVILRVVVDIFFLCMRKIAVFTINKKNSRS